MASWISKNKRLAIYKRDNQVCCYCGKHCDIGDTRTHANPTQLASLDHIVPQKELAAAATDDKDFSAKRRDAKNLVVVCMGCNSSKCHTPLYVWCSQTGKDYAAIITRIAERIVIAC
jgi:5-methylcytosine-specific restriction endonuclease McrA